MLLRETSGMALEDTEQIPVWSYSQQVQQFSSSSHETSTIPYSQVSNRLKVSQVRNSLYSTAQKLSKQEVSYFQKQHTNIQNRNLPLPAHSIKSQKYLKRESRHKDLRNVLTVKNPIKSEISIFLNYPDEESQYQYPRYHPAMDVKHCTNIFKQDIDNKTNYALINSMYTPELVEKIFNKLLFNFSETKERISMIKLLQNINFTDIFESFCIFLPITLIDGFVILKKYLLNSEYRLQGIKELLHTYLACCLISHKFVADTPSFNLDLIARWDILLKDINYLEALIINAINYNAHISDYERGLAMLKIFDFSPSKGEIKHRI